MLVWERIAWQAESMFVRIIANAAALIVAAFVFPGIHLDSSGGLVDQIVTALVVAFIFGLINSLVRPIIKLISLPLVILTLGLFLVVINGLMLMLTSTISIHLGLGFRVDSWFQAFFGSILISLVSAIVGGALGAKR